MSKLYRMGGCIICGAKFRPLSWSSRVCSIECRRARKAQTNAILWQMRKRSMPCIVCGNEFVPIKKRSTCGVACAKELKRRHNAKHYWSDPDKYRLNNKRKCAICGSIFVARGSYKTCSDGCSIKLRYNYQKVWRINKTQENPPMNNCRICGVRFVITHGNQHTCCVEHSKELAKLRETQRHQRDLKLIRYAKQILAKTGVSL